MGKGQRARAARAAEREANREIIAQRERKQKITKITTWVVSIVLLLTIVGGITINSIQTANVKNGTSMRNATVLETENYSVNAAMMSVYFYQEYNQMYSSLAGMSENSAMSGLLDPTKSLKSQESYMLEDGGTWYDYFLEQAISKVKRNVYLAEKALADGMKLTEEDEKGFEASFDAYTDAAKTNNLSLDEFISAYFGTGVNEDDIRDCLEIEAMANKYQAKYLKSLSYTDKEIDAYYEKNIDAYRYVDYYSYTVSASDTANKSTYAAAEKAANELAAVDSTKEFSAWVEKYERDNGKITEDYTKEALEADIKDTLASLLKEKALYSEGDEASKWLFEKAKVGDTKVFDNKSGGYTVYYLVATPYRDTAPTRTIRQILLTSNTHGSMEAAKDMANKVLKELGAKKWSEEAFDEYARNFSEDGTNLMGGLCENYTESQLDSEVAKWAFDQARNKGDAKVIKGEESYTVCYFEGVGVEAWKASCIDSMKKEAYEKAYEKWTKDIAMTETAEGYDEIPDNV